MIITNHSVSEPPGVQLKSAELDVILEADSPVGSGHAGQALIPVTLEGVDEPAPWSTINTPF